ncbi:hypothetical protein C8R44DRAFT_945903 [Mycena epipterygia]|nr:hypothetical protein C8R44DRAFT_945903 [Mycena epipterygia]
MSGILALPTELVHEIASQIYCADQKNLRTTCRTLNFTVEPLVLCHLVIDANVPNGEQLQLISQPSYRGASLVKTVDIRRLVPDDPIGGPDNVVDQEFLRTFTAMRESLIPALSSLRNMRSLRWELDREEPTGTPIEIINTLRSLPHFSELNIVLPEPFRSTLPFIPPSVPFDRLSGLRSISIWITSNIGDWARVRKCIVHPLAEAIANSPGLESMKVVRDYRDYYEYRTQDQDDPSKEKERPCFHHLSKVDPRHPLRLKSLVLQNDVVDLDELSCAHLTCLDELAVKLATQRGLYDSDDGDDFTRKYAHSPRAYLRSHPGLKRLTLTGIEQLYHPRYFDVHADTFYANVLPLHAATLTHLSISPGRRGRWTLSELTAGAILQCRTLVQLSMPSDEGDLAQEPRVDNTLLLIDIACELPHLEMLTITLVHAYTVPGGRVCGTGRLRRRQEWFSATTDTVERYRIFNPDVEKSMVFALLIDDSSVYQLVPSGDPDGSMRFGKRVDEVKPDTGRSVAARRLGANRTWYNRAYVEKLPPTRRVRVGELRLK